MLTATRIVIVTLVLLAISSVATRADVPGGMNVSGRLADTAGNAAAPGPKDFTFKIFDSEIGGTEVWPAGLGEDQTITTDQNGLWNAYVGAVVPLSAFHFQDTSRWLEITVDDGVNPPETLPRTRLVTTPFAYRVATVDGADGGIIIGDVTVLGDLDVPGKATVDSVGIGTGAPTARLHVAGTPGVDGIRFPDGSLQTTAATGGGGGSGWTDDGTVVRLDTGSDRVGVGTSSPSEKLDVTGNIHASGTISSGNSITIDGTTNEISATGSKISLTDDTLVSVGALGVGTSNLTGNTVLRAYKVYSTSVASQGIFNHVENTSNGWIYGIKNEASNAFGGGNVYGIHNTVTTGTGARTGIYSHTFAYDTASAPATSYALKGLAQHGPQAHGVYGEATGATTGYGVYGTASGNGTNYAGYFNGNTVVTGHLGIGVANPTNPLEVDGTVWSKSGGFRFPDGSLQTTADTGPGFSLPYSNYPSTMNTDTAFFVQTANASDSSIGIGAKVRTDPGVSTFDPVAVWGEVKSSLPLDNYRAAGVYGQVEGNQSAGVKGYAWSWGDGWSYGGQFELEGNGGSAIRADWNCQSGDGYAGEFYSDRPSSTAEVIHVEYTGDSSLDARAVYGKSRRRDYYGIGGEFEGGYVGVRGRVYPTGSSSYYGVYGAVSGGSGTNRGVYGTASGAGTNWAGYFSGNVNVTGTLSKGGGSFKIDHPLDPQNKYLQHSFVESPDMMNIYNGNVVTDANGDANVQLAEYFSALNHDFRYQLTVIGQFAQAIVSEKMNGNRFSIKTDKPNVEVSWQVTGVRKDAFAEANRIQVEVDKPDNEVGKYLHPVAFGLSPSLAVDYDQNAVKSEGRLELDKQ